MQNVKFIRVYPIAGNARYQEYRVGNLFFSGERTKIDTIEILEADPHFVKFELTLENGAIIPFIFSGEYFVAGGGEAE